MLDLLTWWAIRLLFWLSEGVQSEEEMVSMNGRGHSAYVREGHVVVEYYHFGEDVDYEYATELIFEGENIAQLASSLEIKSLDSEEIVETIAANFETMWNFKRHVEERHVIFKEEVDFWP
jgi:hypothetical protein